MTSLDPSTISAAPGYAARAHATQTCNRGSATDGPSAPTSATRSASRASSSRTEARPRTSSPAGKVHNGRCSVNDIEADGPSMWLRFNAGAAELARLALRMAELS